MFDLKQLCEFLVQAKKSTYALGDDSIKIKESDGSTSLIFEKGDWKYHDNYFGGEPYGGREVVFFKNKPVYIMVYYGQIKNFSIRITSYNVCYTKLLRELVFRCFQKLLFRTGCRHPLQFSQCTFVTKW